MKTGNLIGIVGLACLGVTAANAQQWTFGPKAEIGVSARSTPANELTIGDVQITTGGNAGDALGTGGGGFARYDRSRWYGQAELLTQRANVFNYDVLGKGLGFAEYVRVSRLAGRLLGGYKPLPWLRLTGGVSVNQYRRDLDNRYQSIIGDLYQRAAVNPSKDYGYLSSAQAYEVAQSINNSIRSTTLDLMIGLGVDIGGLTVDLINASSLTPVIDGVSYQGQSYPLRQGYSNWSLQLGYRLFPVKAHLLAPRRSNRAYERIKKDIPFYRNEIHVAGGMLGEDIGSAFLYENRYTRYLTRRFGLSLGANLMRRSTGFLPKEYTQVQVLPAIRFVPLYSRRHTIGLSAGPLLSYQTGFEIISGGKNADGSIAVVNLRTGSQLDRLSIGGHASIDYQFAISDRLLIGPWLRIATKSAYTGIQAGYRF